MCQTCLLCRNRSKVAPYLCSQQHRHGLEAAHPGAKAVSSPILCMPLELSLLNVCIRCTYLGVCILQGIEHTGLLVLQILVRGGWSDKSQLMQCAWYEMCQLLLSWLQHEHTLPHTPVCFVLCLLARSIANSTLSIQVTSMQYTVAHRREQMPLNVKHEACLQSSVSVAGRGLICCTRSIIPLACMRLLSLLFVSAFLQSVENSRFKYTWYRTRLASSVL